MGRLFWKFFACTLLAQLATTIGVGAVFWLRDPARMQQAAAMPRAIDMGPSAEFLIDAAAATLAHGGSAALRDLVASDARNSIFVIDAQGRDMVGRAVTPEARAQAEQVLESGTSRHKVVRTLTAPDGARFLVFVRSMRGRGPGSPPPGGHGPGSRGPGGPGGPPGHGFPYMTIGGATLASLLFAGLLAWFLASEPGAAQCLRGRVGGRPVAALRCEAASTRRRTR